MGRLLVIVLLGACRIHFDEVGSIDPAAEICTTNWCWENPPVSAELTLRAISGSSANDVWAVGDAGVIQHWDGTTWRMIDSPTREVLRAVSVVSPTDVTVAAGAGMLWHYDGASWTSSTLPEGTAVSALWRDASGRLWTGDQTGVVREDGTAVSTGPTPSATMGLHGAPGNSVWFVGQFNVVSHWTGAVWSGVLIADFPAAVWATSTTTFVGGDDIWSCNQMPQCTQLTGTVATRAFWGASDSDVWAVGGTIQHWDGSAWSQVVSPTTVVLHGVWGAAADDIWAIGERGAIIHYDGASWTSLTSPAPAPYGWGAFWVVDDADRWLSTGGQMWHASEESLDQVPLPATASIGDEIRGTSATDIYALDVNSGVLHFDGASWTAEPSVVLAMPRGLAATPNEVLASSMTGEIVMKKSGTWSNVFSLSPDEVHGLCISDGGTALAVARFGNAGARLAGTWARNDSPTGRLLLACDFAGEQAWAVGGDAVVSFAGGSWTVVTGTTSLQSLTDVIAVTPSEIYVSGYHGAVMSFDGAWHEEPTPVGYDFYKLGRSASGTMYVVGGGNVILRRR